MTPDAFTPAIGFIIKLLVLLGLGIYAIFAFVMVRQEHLMGSVLEEKFEPFLRLLVYIHMALSLGLMAFAFVIL